MYVVHILALIAIGIYIVEMNVIYFAQNLMSHRYRLQRRNG